MEFESIIGVQFIKAEQQLENGKMTTASLFTPHHADEDEEFFNLS